MNSNTQKPINIGTHKQLFVDDHIIGQADHVFRILNQPIKHKDNPVIELKPAQKVGGNELIVADGSVIYDQDERLFKMWYEAANYDWSHNYVAYAVSQDGVHWELPSLGLIEHQGSKNNNLVFHRGGGEMAPGVIKDPVDQNPQRRYKMIYNCGHGVGVAFSPDGIHWTPAPGVQVAELSDSPNSVLWDAQLRKYVAHTRRWEKLSFPGHRLGTRVVLQSESDDFLHWTAYGTIMRPDEQDPVGNRQFYNMEWMPYENVYLGFIAVYHILPGMEPKITPGVPWLDTVDIQLAFSRDDRHWERAGDRQVFIPLTPAPEAFDSAMIYVMQHPIVVNDEVWIYYVGFNGRHWATRRNEIQGGAVGLAKLRLDGFVSMDAGEGILTTKPFIMAGDHLIVNADARWGSVIIEILDADGVPIAGFSKNDALPIRGDSVRHIALWNGQSNVGGLKGKPIALRFHLDRAKLYSFVFQTAL